MIQGLEGALTFLFFLLYLILQYHKGVSSALVFLISFASRDGIIEITGAFGLSDSIGLDPAVESRDLVLSPFLMRDSLNLVSLSHSNDRGVLTLNLLFLQSLV